MHPPDFCPRRFLRELRERHRDLPAQGTRAWREARHRTAGGSDAATVLGLNPYSTPQRLIAERAAGRPFAGSTNTYWGNLTEPITRAWVAHHFACEIVELGTLPGPIPHQTFSGDGFGVVRTPWETAQGVRFALDELVIFEFKSLCARAHLFEEPAPPGADPEAPPATTRAPRDAAGRQLELHVPPYYAPQIQVGLMTVPEAAYSVYAEALIRRCAVHALDASPEGACADFGEPAAPLPAPLGAGVVGLRWRGPAPGAAPPAARPAPLSAAAVAALVASEFAAPAAPPPGPPWLAPLLALWAEFARAGPAHGALVLPDGLELLGEPPEARLLDFARMPAAVLATLVPALLDDQHERGLAAVYPASPAEPPAETLRRLRAECAATGSEPLGVLGFKVFSVYMRPVPRDPGFAARYRPQVERFLRVLHWALERRPPPSAPEVRRALAAEPVAELAFDPAARDPAERDPASPAASTAADVPPAPAPPPQFGQKNTRQLAA